MPVVVDRGMFRKIVGRISLSVDPALCQAITQAKNSYKDYINQAITVAVGPLLEPSAGSLATAIIRFEIISLDDVCQSALADACVHIVSRDDDIRFVAPSGAAADNHVSYWHRELDQTGQLIWASLAPGQRSSSHEVLLLGQTLPEMIAPESGAGYLHNVPGRSDGWTVSVGVYHQGGRNGLDRQPFKVAVSARPYESPSTDFRDVSLA